MNRQMMDAYQEKMTPHIANYISIARRHPEYIIFYKLGDFYELFFDDALRSAELLGFTVTSRKDGIPMCGVPYHALYRSTAKLDAIGIPWLVVDGDSLQFSE